MNTDAPDRVWAAMLGTSCGQHGPQGHGGLPAAPVGRPGPAWKSPVGVFSLAGCHFLRLGVASWLFSYVDCLGVGNTCEPEPPVSEMEVFSANF